MNPLIDEQRKAYHMLLCEKVLGYREGNVTNADKDSKTSKEIAKRLAETVAANAGVKLGAIAVSGQELGKHFTSCTETFLKETFWALGHLRPGKWHSDTSQASPGIARYEPYVHLGRLQALIERLAEDDPEVAAAFDTDYLITPDIVIAREPEPDQDINANNRIIVANGPYAAFTPLRKRHESQPMILHASISCKWTLRSDRAQNARTEALNLIRNRKGRAPHIVVVTGEPMPTRIASIALGTGDIDCVYHIALPELHAAVREAGKEDQEDMLDQLINGGRLRDISDLPLDLAI